MYHALRGCPTPKRARLLLLLSLPLFTLLYVLLLSPGEVANWLPSSGDGDNTTPPPTKRNYTILVWRQGERMKRRFLRSYGKDATRDPFESCSVRNCELSSDDDQLEKADAVMFHLHQTKGPATLPRGRRPPGQIWIFFTDESPLHTFLLTRQYTMRDYNGIFNWSMTYRSDSDVPVPYGRTVPLSPEEGDTYEPVDHYRTNTKLVAVLGSNCGGKNHRWEYIRELQKHIRVDVYGGCGGNRTACPGHFARDCPAIAGYKFYLAFENSDCTEYLTEKLWWNAYAKGSVPVVMGAPRGDYERLCPPDSFVHVSDFASPADLARYLSFLSGSEAAYNSFFEWRRRYRVSNEHGYFGSPSLHLCRMCKALNARKPPKTYADLAAFWDPGRDCRPPVWTPS